MTEIVVTNLNPNPNPKDTGSIIGECGVCGLDLPSDANHAYTICKHLFCISCLLKWYKANPMATCPMCRASLFSQDPAESRSSVGVGVIRDMAEPNYDHEHEHEHESDYESDEAFFEYAHQQEEQYTRTLIEELDFNSAEEELHETMMLFISIHARNYCSQIGFQSTYMGVINLFNFPTDEYFRCDYGITNPNCHYILVMRDASRAFRYKFGRIENIHADNIIDGIYWFVFREMILSYESHDHVWSTHTQFISFEDVIILKQYIPRIRMSA